MKEIEFRAFVKDKGKIFTVKQMDLEYKMIWFEEENKAKDTMRMFDQIELMQYIGLQDKNGKKIFEGDIVEVWVERNIQGRKQSNQDTLVKARAVVDYGETFCNIAYYLNYDNNYNKKITQPKNKEYYDRDIQQRPIDCFTQQRIKKRLERNNEYQKKMAEIEVIGNIYDNPELLGE